MPYVPIDLRVYSRGEIKAGTGNIAGMEKVFSTNTHTLSNFSWTSVNSRVLASAVAFAFAVPLSVLPESGNVQI